MDSNAFSAPAATVSAAATLSDAGTLSDAARLSANVDAMRALDTARRSITIYAVLATAALGVVIAVSSTGHPANTFMWVRGLLLTLVAPVLLRLLTWAAGGSRRSFDRLRALTVVLPVAIIGIDLIPGVCPLWYAAMQAVCMLPILHVSVLTRGGALRGAFGTADRR